MTRSKLIQLVSAKQGDLSVKKVEASVKYIFNKMADGLRNGRRIEIRGFGSFSIRCQPAWMVRNPKTGVNIRQESKYSLHFKAGKEMRDRVNV